ncbi:MAG: hypothetical protein ACYTKD_11435, partial [Planctomycetota bacterium]
VECLKRRIHALNHERRNGPEELLFVTRERAGDKMKHDFDYDPWDVDPATEGEELDAALENRELTVGLRIFPMAEEGLVGGYVALSVSAVDIRFEVDGYGESTGQATGVAAAVGYRYPVKETPLLAYAELGVGLWNVPELDLVSAGGDVARYRERRTALKPVMPHLNFGLLCCW